METPLDVLARVATRERDARNAASVKMQSRVRVKKATRKANAVRNAKIPGQLTALSNKTRSLIPKDLNKTVSRFLVKPAGKTKKANKNKKGGMSCGSHVPKKSKRAGKTKRKRNNKFR